MLAMVWVVQTGSITRTSACMTARSTFSCATAVSGSSRAARAARTRIIMFSPRISTVHTLCDGHGPFILENESARFCISVERPDRPFDLGVGDLGRVALQRAAGINVDHLLGDRA